MLNNLSIAAFERRYFLLAFFCRFRDTMLRMIFENESVQIDDSPFYRGQPNENFTAIPAALRHFPESVQMSGRPCDPGQSRPA